ncbi:MAG: signal peptidase II [Rhodocyclaceae bacterium]
MTANKRFSLWLGVSALVIVLDQYTKWLVQQALALGEGIPVTSFFDLVFVYNRGAAFSFLANHSGWQRWFFVGLAVVICGWLLAMLRRHQDETLQPLAFTLVIGGAIGNVIDRLAHGAVVDFLYFHAGRYGWPAFNVADSAICVGVALMVLAQLRAPHAGPQKKASTT